MAVSNALGSNVFDINLGLGLPFLIKTLYKNGPLVLQEVGIIQILVVALNLIVIDSIRNTFLELDSIEDNFLAIQYSFAQNKLSSARETTTYQIIS